MPRRKPYTKSKVLGDTLATIVTMGMWLFFRIPWELYMWSDNSK